MKKKNLLALLLALCLCLGLLAGCGNSGVASATEASGIESAAEEEAPAEEAPAEEEAPAAEEAPAVDYVAADSSVEGNDGATVAVTVADPFEAMAEEYISYPLEEAVDTISMWYYIPGYQDFMDSNYSFNALKTAEEATGIKLEFVEVSDSSAATQFNLMVAGGDMTDLIPVSEYYTNGLTQAYEDGVVLDIEPYIDEYMPNYAAVRETLAESTVNSTLTDGMTLAFYQIKDGSYSGNGFVTRQDWIDGLGWEWSGDLISIDEFTEYATAIKNEYNVPNTIYMYDGTIALEAAFDTEIPALVSDGFMTMITSAIFRYDDEVTSGWITDGYRDYLQWVLDMMDEGVIYRDYLSLDTDRNVTNSLQANGTIGIWGSNADKISEVATNFEHDTDDFALTSIPRVTKDPTAQYVWNDEVAYASAKFSLSSSCENPEVVCMWQNYFWTEDGYYLGNYGTEGESYHMDGDTPVFDWDVPITVTGRNAPNAEMAQQLWTMSRFAAFYVDNDMLLATFDDVALEAVSKWTIDGATDARNYPSALMNTGMTTDETDAINAVESDVLTYAQTEAMKFLDGSSELNDDTWATYTQTVLDMGMQDIIDIYQTAYDEYLAGER